MWIQAACHDADDLVVLDLLDIDISALVVGGGSK